jgi:hypothetical protein
VDTFVIVDTEKAPAMFALNPTVAELNCIFCEVAKKARLEPVNAVKPFVVIVGRIELLVAVIVSEKNPFSTLVPLSPRKKTTPGKEVVAGDAPAVRDKQVRAE